MFVEFSTYLPEGPSRSG